MRRLLSDLSFKRAVIILSIISMLATAFPYLGGVEVSGSSANLVNGDFENGLTGYQNSGTTVFKTITDPGKRGNHILQFSGSETRGNGSVWQEVSVTPNTDYIWSFRHKKSDSNNDKTLVYVENANGKNLILNHYAAGSANGLCTKWDSTGAWYVDNSDDNWATFGIYFNSGDATLVKLKLNAWVNTRTVYVDDWNLKEMQSATLENGDFSVIEKDGKTPAGYNIVKDSDDVAQMVNDPSGHTGMAFQFSTGALSEVNKSGFYQAVSVKPNTEYVWSFWLNNAVGVNHYIGVVSGVSVNPDGNTTLPAKVTVTEGMPMGFSQNAYGWGMLGKSGDQKTADTNWMEFGWDNNGWKQISVRFNSGNNSAVSLAYVARGAGRTVYFDDWSINEHYVLGETINGNFEAGLTGYSYDDSIAVEITEAGFVHGGEKAAAITATSAGQRFKQKVHLEKNTDYVWKFWVKTALSEQQFYISDLSKEMDCIPSKITASVGSGKTHSDDDGKHTLESNRDWYEYSITFNSASYEELLLNFVSLSAGTLYTDDWSLGKIIEPGTLVNPGFEDGLSGYSETDGATATTDETQSGNGAAYLNLSAKTKFYQTVSVKPDTKYKWTFWAKKHPNNSGVYLIGVSKGEDSNILLPSSFDTVTGSAYLENKIKESERPADKDSSEWHFISWNEGWVQYSVIFTTGNQSNVNLTMYAFGARKLYTDSWALEEINENRIQNSGFEDGISDCKKDGGMSLSADKENRYFDSYSLKMSGNGKMSKEVEVPSYSNCKWTFYYKTSEAAKGYISVRSKSGDTLLPSEMQLLYGTGTVNKNNFSDERPDGNFSEYHEITSDGTWSKYSVTFKSGKNTKVLLTYGSDSDINAYTDGWDLRGSFVYNEDVLLNGGFEDAALSGYSADKLLTAGITDKNPHSGSYAASISKGDGTGQVYFSQTVKLRKNSDYMWTFWIRFDDDKTPVGAAVGEYGGNLIYTPVAGDNNSVVEVAFDWARIRYSDNEWHQYRLMISTENNDMFDLKLVAYAANAAFTTDDWNLEYIGNTPEKTDTLLDIGFEDENMQGHSSDGACWFRTDKYAKTGSYSIKYDGRNAGASLEMNYHNEYGVRPQIFYLDAEATYRYSFWYRGDGKLLDMANIRVAIENSNGYQRFYDKYYGCDDKEWHYVEAVFTTGKTALGHRFLIWGTNKGFASFNIYVDDIKLEKISGGTVTAVTEPDGMVCQDNQNIIPDGAVNVTQIGEKWNNIEGLNVINDAGKKAIQMSSGTNAIYKLQLRSYGKYCFAASYRTELPSGTLNALAQIGLSYSEDAAPFTSSIFEITDTQGLWKREAYTFNAPTNGIVYLIFKNGETNVSFDDLMLFSLLPNPTDPKDMTKKTDTAAKPQASIWDSDFDFDFDWNTDSNVSDTIDISDSSYYDQQEITEEEITPSNRKKMLRVKRRSLVSKGKPGINVWLIVIIVTASAMAVGVAVFITVRLYRRRKKKLKQMSN